MLTIETAPAPEGSPTSPPAYDASAEKPQPATVTIPGTLQSVLGCPGDWQPDCEETFLTLDPEDKIWQGEWTLPAGDYEYKAALNQSWDLNFGLNAVQNGPNIPLNVPAEQPVKFYYDHQTSWVTDNLNSIIAVAVGNFQDELGCNRDDDPGCLRSWLQDHDGDGTYTFIARELPPGEYTARVAINESLDEVYGADGVLDGPGIPFTVEEDGGGEVYFEYSQETNILMINTSGAPKGDLSTARAHWVSRDTIAWKVDTGEAASFQLVYAPEGGLTLSPTGVDGGFSIPLSLEPFGLTFGIASKFPHLRGHEAFKINPENLDKVPGILRGQIAVVAFDAEGKPFDATTLQIPGVIDDLYTYDGPLGVGWDAASVPTLRVWAPTARSVNLLLYTGSDPQTIPMDYDPATGVWSVTGEPGWSGQFYLYEIEVYAPSTGKIETNQVTDPYSISLSTNSTRSQIVNLDDPDLIPAGWGQVTKPALAAPEDIVLYELHVRDFSVNDPSVPKELRGTFAAFTVADSNGMNHLRALAEAGLTHLHLLPAFDIASVNEDKSTWVAADFDTLSAL
ncbi:MAG: DUF3372 domain-containing protein, partial [Anaerolineales bacterium]